MKHKVKMLKSEDGVHDGEIYPVHFAKDTEHEIGPDLLSAFVSTGSVELIDDEDSEEEGTTEDKSEGDAPQNKAKKSAPENKAKK